MKICTEIKDIFGGGNFWGKVKIFRPMKMLVVAIIIVFLTSIGQGVKNSRWGNLLSWNKRGSKMCWVQCMISAIQFLCISTETSVTRDPEKTTRNIG